VKVSHCAVHIDKALFHGILEKSLSFFIDIPLIYACSLRQISIVPFLRERISRDQVLLSSTLATIVIDLLLVHMLPLNWSRHLDSLCAQLLDCGESNWLSRHEV
jgi:hypothetical protein